MKDGGFVKKGKDKKVIVVCGSVKTLLLKNLIQNTFHHKDYNSFSISNDVK
jgi:hypothetical protein